MADPDTTCIAEGRTNTTPGSCVDAHVQRASLFLMPETGEVLAVPSADGAALRSEYMRLSMRVADYHCANEALALADERMAAIALADAQRQFVDHQVREDARQGQLWALEWRDQANEALRDELKPLGKLDGTGKKLVELIPLMQKPGDKPYAFSVKTEDVKLDKTDLKRTFWNVKTGVGLREKMNAWADPKNPAKLPEKLVYVRSDKLKPAWPKFKDQAATKWSEVYKKDATGKRQLDPAKLKRYVTDQAKAVAKIKTNDFVDLKAEVSGTLAGEWAEQWNRHAVKKGEASAKLAGVQVADVDLSAEAALMRYTAGGSLNATFDPLKAGVALKAEGHADVALAEGKASCDLYLPSRDGIMLYVLALDMSRYDLGAVRLQVKTELSGVVGASIGAEIGMGVEMREFEVPAAKGAPAKGSRRKRSANVGKTATEVDNVGTVSAELSVFAGARADASINGAFQWRNPETKDKKFVDLASVVPTVSGQAGIGGTAQFSCDYRDGTFRLTASAGICIGLGAEGKVSLAVGVKQLAEFFMWCSYQLYHCDYRNLEILTRDGFTAVRDIAFLAVQGGKAIEECLQERAALLTGRVNEIQANVERAADRQTLAHQILSKPFALRYSPPETKGMLIYRLTRFGGLDWVLSGGGIGDAYLGQQRRAVLALLRLAQTRRDMENIVQHIDPLGAKQSLAARLSDLERFFAADAPGGVDLQSIGGRYKRDFKELLRSLPAQGDQRLALEGGEFGDWYETVYASLKDEPTRGLAMVPNDTAEYSLQVAMQGRDHTLFASTGDRAYYG
jgi:hypothetical protein